MTAFDNSDIEAKQLANEIKNYLEDKGFEVSCCELAKDFGVLFLEIKHHVVTINNFTKPNNEECMMVDIKFKAKEIQVKSVLRPELQELKEAMNK
jgi:hypothetical protein